MPCFLLFFYFLCIVAVANSFSAPGHVSNARYPMKVGVSPDADSGPPARPNLVLETTLLAAHEELYHEIAKSQGTEYINEDDENIGYAIARLEVQLGIPPEIDLVETKDLVLVNGVTQGAMDQGIRPLDTIVSVSCGNSYKGETLGLNLDETVVVIKEAMQYAEQNGKDSIKFELNRLMRGTYKM
jgi:hypothetical protein